MLKMITQLESIVEGKAGRFMVEHDATIQQVKEMLFQFGAYVSQIEAQAKAQMEAAAQAQAQESKPEGENDVQHQQQCSSATAPSA